MSPYFPLGPFLVLSCLGFLTFLPPLSLRAIVSLLQLSSFVRILTRPGAAVEGPSGATASARTLSS
jgi:hypothetical protein